MAALLLLGLVAAPLGVMAQTSGCLQLTGSTMCPAFTDQYINPANLSGSWPFMSNVNSVASFDSQLADYLTNQYEFRATKYQRQLGCQNTSTTFTLQYARTFLCSEFTQISYSAGCYPAGATKRMACQSTCLMFAASENNLVADTLACNPIANYAPRAGNLTKDFAACTDWTSLATNDTTTCVLGQLNEPNCGYGASTSQLCSRCNPAQGSVDSCCGVASSNVTAFCGFNLAAAQILPTSATNPTSVSQTALLPSSTGAYTGGAASASAPAPTSTAGSGAGVGQSNSGASTTGGSSGLSGGAIAGVVIGAIAGVLLLGGLIAFFLLRRRKTNSAAARSPSSFNDNEKAAAFGAGGAAAAGGAGALAVGAAMKEKSLEKPYGSSAALAKPYNAPSSTNASSRNLPSPSLAESGDGKGLAAAAGLGAAGAAAAGASRPVSGVPTAGSGSSGSNDGRNLVSSYRDQYSSTDITPGSDVVAIYSYQPNLPDELALEPEMIVTVRKIFDDGWASGRITRGAVAGRASEGAFPLVVCTALGADMNDNASTSSSISSRRAMTAESGGLPMSSARSGRTSSIGASSFDTAHETGPESVDEEHTARQGGFLSNIVGNRR